jgi:ferric-dicitrate binding protein FerR (iron transport regulator)
MRDVALEGEATFTVVHDAALPFTVRTATARTVDVGTQFDVRAYAGDPATRIAVEEGEVAVSRVGRGLPATISDMRAGDLAIVSDTAVSVTHGVDVGALTAWTAGQLRVHDVPLRDLVPDLQRWYDVDVFVADSALAGRLVTASWAAEPTEQMLAELGALLNARVVRRGRAVTLVPLP